MDKAITTALLIVISVLMSLMLFNAAYPAITQGGDAIANMAKREDDRLKSQITVIHAAGELDDSGHWQDTNGNGQFDVFVWVKNVGSTTISPLERLDIFFGPEGNYSRIPLQSEANGSYPYWTWQLENNSVWSPAGTLRITIHYQFPQSSGRYYLKVVLPNGISDQEFVGM